MWTQILREAAVKKTFGPSPALVSYALVRCGLQPRSFLCPARAQIKAWHLHWPQLTHHSHPRGSCHFNVLVDHLGPKQWEHLCDCSTRRAIWIIVINIDCSYNNNNIIMFGGRKKKAEASSKKLKFAKLLPPTHIQKVGTIMELEVACEETKEEVGKAISCQNLRPDWPSIPICVSLDFTKLSTPSNLKERRWNLNNICFFRLTLTPDRHLRRKWLQMPVLDGSPELSSYHECHPFSGSHMSITK